MSKFARIENERSPRARRACLALLLAAAPALAAATAIPSAFHGTWVRSDAACDAALSLKIEAARLTFRNGAQSQTFGQLAVETPTKKRPTKGGTTQVLAEAPDGSPFLLFLSPGPPPFVNLNWRPLDESISKRFRALAPEKLKHCPR
jgi:hypothetical protein